MCKPLTSLLTWRTYKRVFIFVYVLNKRSSFGYIFILSVIWYFLTAVLKMSKKLSDYFYSLSSEDQLRYLEKLIPLGGIDPYAIKKAEFCQDASMMPKMSMEKINSYLLFQISSHTQQEMRAYKSMEAFVKVACKWVKNIDFKYIEDCCVVIGKVLHSQRINETPLKPWIILKNEEILYAHCTCIAGLGETCSHVASVLFFLEMVKEKSVTDVAAYWAEPAKKNAYFASVQDIDWSTPSHHLQQVVELPKSEPSTSIDVPPMSVEEMADMLTEMKSSGCESAILKITPPFFEEYVRTREKGLPAPLSHLYNENLKDSSAEEVLSFCQSISVSVTKMECDLVENLTRNQARCAEWFEQRIGRVTASNFKAVCRTNIEHPSLSLLKTICDPKGTVFKTKSTVYGCEHEEMAANDYSKKQALNHANFEMKEVGLIISPSYPFFGASPDKLISCDCCGKGCLEIKCPYCIGNLSVEEVRDSRKHFCLMPGTNTLNRQHPYFYQVQMQMALTEMKYCDFVVWGKKNFVVDRISFDPDFWTVESGKAEKFFKAVILPEIVCNFFTKKCTQ